MPQTFGDYLRSCLDRLKITQAEYGRRVGHPRGFINNVITGDRTPPLDELELWFSESGSGDFETFFFLAAVAHLPEKARERYVELGATIARRRELAGELAREKADVIEENLQLRAEIRTLSARVAELENKYKP